MLSVPDTKYTLSIVAFNEKSHRSDPVVLTTSTDMMKGIC